MALAGIKAKVLLMPSATDLYFQTDDNRVELPHLKHGKLAEIPSVWGHRAGNPLANPEDAAFIDKQVEGILSAAKDLIAARHEKQLKGWKRIGRMSWLPCQSKWEDLIPEDFSLSLERHGST